MLDRFAETSLKEWIIKQNRKPLVLRGARQVGKSTLVRQFAAKNNIALNEINLERHLYLNDIFKTLDTFHIIHEIEALIGSNIQKPNSILFLDEIQATPHALHALRYLYEEKPELPIISAGSLLEFTLSDHSFPMPVGRIEYFHLGPMSFKEFIHAIDPGMLKYISDFTFETGIPLSAHKKLLKRQREYLLVGGMPEAVAIYCKNGTISDVNDVHRSIVDTYLDDFSKYAIQKELALMQRVFRYIPRSIGKKIKYSNISREQRTKSVKHAIDLLSMARTCHKVFHSHCSGIPLYADINDKAYKLLFMDIGIVNHICGNDWITLQSFLDSELVNEGSLAEQFIGQHLILINNEAPKLCYWLREAKSTNAEVDYVMSFGNLIVPIEVKAGKSGTLKSLQQFVLRKNSKYAARFDLNIPSMQSVQHTASTEKRSKSVAFNLLSLPLYMVEELSRIINLIRE